MLDPNEHQIVKIIVVVISRKGDESAPTNEVNKHRIEVVDDVVDFSIIGTKRVVLVRNDISVVQGHIVPFTKKTVLKDQPFVAIQPTMVVEEDFIENIMLPLDHYNKMVPVAQGTIIVDHPQVVQIWAVDEVNQVKVSCVDLDNVAEIKEEVERVASAVFNQANVEIDY